MGRMGRWRSVRSGACAVVVYVVLAGCGGGGDDGTPVSAYGVVAKADLDGAWYAVTKVVAADDAARAGGFVGDMASEPAGGHGIPGMALPRITWRIEQDELRGVRDGGDRVLVTLPVVEHVDAERAEDGSLVAVPSDRPPEERPFVEVDFGRMVVATPYEQTRTAAAVFGDADPEAAPLTVPPGWDPSQAAPFFRWMDCTDPAGDACDPVAAAWADAFGPETLFAFGGLTRRGWACDGTAECAGGSLWSRVTFLKQGPGDGHVPKDVTEVHERARYLTVNGRLLQPDLAAKPLVWHASEDIPDHLLRPLFESASAWNAAWVTAARAARGEDPPVYPDVSCQDRDPDAPCFCVPDPETGTPIRTTCRGRYDPHRSPAEAAEAGVTDPIRCHIDGAPAAADLSDPDLEAESFAGWREARMVGDECHLRVQAVDCASGVQACVMRGEGAVPTIVASQGDLLVATRLGADPETGQLLTGSIAVGTEALRREAQLAILAQPFAEAAAPAATAWRSGAVDDVVMIEAADTLLQSAAARADALLGAAGEVRSLRDVRADALAATEVAQSLLAPPESFVFAGWEHVAGPEPDGADLRSPLHRDLGFDLAAHRHRQASMARALVQPAGFASPWDPTLERAAETTSAAGLAILVERRVLRTAMLQAMGHALGLAHNPAASTDRGNYDPAYYEGLEALPLPVDESEHGDWLTREERAEFEAAFARVLDRRARYGVPAAMRGSVMDLPHARAWPSHAVGHYDRMAVALGYHGLVDAYLHDTIPSGQDPTPHNAERELVPVDDVDHDPNRVEVRYQVCGIDDLVRGDHPRCIARDLGDDYRAIVRNQARLYPFAATVGGRRLGRGRFEPAMHFAQLARVFGPALHVYRTLLPRMLDGTDPTDPAPFGAVEQLYAAADLLNLLARVAAAPPDGGYWYRASLGDPDIYTASFVSSATADALVFPETRRRPWASRYAEDGTGRMRLERVGRLHDALFALELAASRSLDGGGPRAVWTNFQDLLPQSTDLLFDGYVRQDPAPTGVTVTCPSWPGSFPDCDAPAASYPDMFEQGCYGPYPDLSCRPPPRPAPLAGSEDALGSWATLLALMHQPASDDRTTDARLYVCTEGRPDCAAPSDDLVEGTDYVRYISYGMGRQFLAYADGSTRSIHNKATGFAAVDEAEQLSFLVRMLRKYRGDYEAGDPPPSIDHLTPEEQMRLAELGYGPLPGDESGIADELGLFGPRLDELEQVLLRLSVLNERVGNAQVGMESVE